MTVHKEEQDVRENDNVKAHRQPPMARENRQTIRRTTIGGVRKHQGWRLFCAAARLPS